MTVYWLAMFVSYIFAKAYDKLHEHRLRGYRSDGLELAALAACALVLICVTGFRYQVGADYPAYQNYFYQVLFGAGQGRFEYGYYLLNLVCTWVTDNPRVMFVASAALFYALVIVAIKRMSPDVSLSVFLLMGCGFFFYFTNGTRQMLAAAFVLLALTTLGKKHNLYFVALVLLGSLFHLSAIVCLLVLVLYRVPVNGKTILVIALLCLLFTRFLPAVAETVAVAFGYGDYLDSDAFTARTGLVQIAINFCILVFGLVMYLRSEGKDGCLRVCVLMQLVAFILSLMTGQVVLIQRIQQLFAFPQVVMIPKALACIETRQMRWLVRLAAILVYVVYMYITVGLWNSNYVLPYRWSL